MEVPMSYVLDNLASNAALRDAIAKQNADEEAADAWREFIAKFRSNGFPLYQGCGGRQYIEWDDLDQFIKRG